MAEEMQPDVDQGQAQSAASDFASDPGMLAAGLSVLLSLYIFYVSGNKLQGIFVGLWAPTFLAFANYFRRKDIDNQLQQAR